jgi:hypothetical protein
MSEESACPDDHAASVLRLIRGQWVSLCVRAAVELKLPDALDRPRDVHELAAAVGADASTLARLLRVLVDLGLVVRDGGLVATTAAGELLRTGHPSGMRNLALMQSEPANVAAWGMLAAAVRSGAGVFEAANGMAHWAHIAADPERVARFNATMARRGIAQAAAIRTGCDLSDVSTIVDVGGGTGSLVVALLEADPRLRAVVADLPHVAADADRAIAAAGLSDRARAVAADFFESVPDGGDAYVISNVLHDWSDEACVRILGAVRDAMRPDSRLWVVEMVLDSPGRGPEEDRDLHLVDLHMLVMFGARERTSAEYGALLAAAGFARVALRQTQSAWDVVEAWPS